MAKLFFGKMNNKEDVDKGIYSAPNESYISNIEPGDYVFVKLEKEYKQAKVKRLWKLNKIDHRNGKVIAHFDKICEFDPIELPKFEALDLFILNMNLLNKCNKQTKGLSFIEIDLLDTENFENLASNPNMLKNYLNDEGHYRQFIKLDNESSAASNGKNVQFYKDNNSWYLIESNNYIGADLKSNYDANQFILFGEHGDKTNNTKKTQMYKFLINDDDCASMNGEGLWDLFCGKVKSNNYIKSQKMINLKENNCDGKSGMLSEHNCSSVGINKIFSYH